jgi:NTP pyrophosphatase (non-canonical NTP hydrolase)
MEFNEYQKECRKTDVGTSAQDCLTPGWLYYSMGVSGEAGEMTEKIKKLFRDKNGIVDDEFKEHLIKEIGDQMWYQARLLDQFDIKYGDVARYNVEKLQSRMERGKIHGDGDDR